MQIKETATIALIILAGYGLKAQTIRIDTTRHTQGTNEVVIFSKDPSIKNRKTDGANIVKFDLLYWVRGVEPFYYERRIADFFTVQAGIGLTTRDFVADLGNLIFGKGGTPGTYGSYSNYSYRKAGVGVYAAFSPKFYIRSDAMDGFWLGPMVEFKRYNFKAQLVQEGYAGSSEPVFTGNYMKEYRNAVDFTFNLGWQWTFSPMTVEYYLGGGFRKFWEVRRDVVANDVGYNGYYYYTNKTTAYNGFRPEFNMGLNLGGFF